MRGKNETPKCTGISAPAATERGAGGSARIEKWGTAGIELHLFTIPLWCPFCGKPHVDRGEWAERPRHKHLCHDDEHGKGCGKLFRVGEPGSSEYVFGAEREHAAIALLVDEVRDKGHDLADTEGDEERVYAFDTAVFRLKRALDGAP